MSGHQVKREGKEGASWHGQSGAVGAGRGRASRASKTMLRIGSLPKGNKETLNGDRQLEEEAMIRFAFRQS